MRFGKLLSLILSISLLFYTVPPIAAAPDTDLVYSHKKNDDMMIALTFDDGPHPRYTPQILDILQKYGIVATFFTIGENVSYYPDVLRRCFAEGHEIANHTYSHKNLSKDCFDNICDEVRAAEEIIFSITEKRPTLLRPPGGLYGENALRAADQMNYTLVLWTIDTRDWEHELPSSIAENILASVESGDIILMHDYISKNSPTPSALELIIPELLSRGYKFVTVSQLLYS